MFYFFICVQLNMLDIYSIIMFLLLNWDLDLDILFQSRVWWVKGYSIGKIFNSLFPELK